MNSFIQIANHPIESCVTCVSAEGARLWLKWHSGGKTRHICQVERSDIWWLSGLKILGKSTNIELDDGKFYRKPLYLMVKTMVSCRFSLKPIQWNKHQPNINQPLSNTSKINQNQLTFRRLSGALATSAAWNVKRRAATASRSRAKHPGTVFQETNEQKLWETTRNHKNMVVLDKFWPTRNWSESE